MKKIKSILFFALLTVGTSRAGQFDVYGWDISCIGTDGALVAASQSDDDFMITFSGRNLSLQSVWADSTVNSDARDKTLVFMTLQDVSPGTEVSLSIERQSIEGFAQETAGGHATGVLLVNRQRFDLNCYARFAKSEDAFYELKAMPFPVIPAPTQR